MVGKNDTDLDLVEIARFPSRLEAETIGHALDQFEIPFIVKGADVGIFGPGMTGVTPEGVGLWVSASNAERVSELIQCAVHRREDPSGTESS